MVPASLGDAGQHGGMGPVAHQVHLQQREVAVAHRCDLRVAHGVEVPRRRKELAHDLRIGLAVEGNALERAADTDIVEQGRVDGAPARPGRGVG